MSFTHTSRILRLEVTGGPEGLFANRLDARETMSADFEYHVEVLSVDARIDVHAMLGKRANLELVREDGSLRHFNGHVVAMRLARTDAGFAYYAMTLGPWTAYLTVTRDHYIFHDVSLVDVIDRTFADYPAAAWEYRITGPVPQYTDCVQHAETDWNHLCRRMERAGWSTWFEHTPGGHTLIISDDTTRCPPIDGDVKVPWQAEAGSAEDDGLSAFAVQARMLSGHRTDADYDFKGARPRKVDVPSIAERGQLPPLEVYDFRGGYGFKNRGDGDALIRREMEAIEAAGLTYEGQGNERSLQPGRWFKLTGHFDERETEFLVTEVRHSVWNNYLQAADAPAQYRNHVSCVPRGIPWRPGPGFNSVDAKVYGTETATVVGPAGEEIHTDKYGRVRVQFHWDRVGRNDQTSSAWVRVASTWAGSNFGAIAIPRIGQEVVISFIGGVADRPLITGSVYNEANMPPWDLPANQTQSGILSRSTKGGAYSHANAIRFEDLKGEEQLWLHAEKDQLTEVEHDEDKWVGNDRRKTIDRDETNHVRRDRTETVDRDEKITVHNNRTERVDHDEKVSIGDNRTEDVGKNESISIGRSQTIHVGDNRSENVGKNETIAIGDNRNETVGKNETVSIGSNRSKSVGKNEKDSIGKNWSIKVGMMKTETIGMTSLQNVGLGRMENVGAAYNLNVGGLMATVVGLNMSTNVGINANLQVGKVYSIDAGTSITIQAGETLVLQIGESTISMNKDGQIDIRGKKINLIGSELVDADSKHIDLN